MLGRQYRWMTSLLLKTVQVDDCTVRSSLSLSRFASHRVVMFCVFVLCFPHVCICVQILGVF